MFSVPRAVTPRMVSGDYHGHSVRRRKFVDGRLQGAMLVALIVLEIGMLVAAMLYLYFQFSAAIEANLYTIHRSAQTPLLPTFLKEMGKVVVCMAAINTLALLIANALWVAHIKRVIADFRERLERVGALDLRQLESEPAHRHEVIALLETWRAVEAQRASQIDGLLACLPEGEHLDAMAEPQLLALVAELDQLVQSAR